MRRAVPGMLSLALLLGACSAGALPAAPSGPTGQPASVEASASPSPPAAAPTRQPAAPTASAETSGAAHGHVVGGSGVFPPYDSLTDWATGQHQVGIAIVEIVEVSEPRWSTPTGERPPEDLLHAPIGHRDLGGYSIGRLVTVRLVRILRGEWPSPTKEARYWLGGGTVGEDSQESLPLHPPVTPAAEGRLGLAFLLAPVLIGMPPTIPSSVAELFPADAQGRIVTPRGIEEGVTLDNVESFLP